MYVLGLGTTSSDTEVPFFFFPSSVDPNIAVDVTGSISFKLPIITPPCL